MDPGYGHCVEKMTGHSFPFKAKVGRRMGASFMELIEIANLHPLRGPRLEREEEAGPG